MDAYDKSNALLSDVILNYKTVISFGQRNVDKINEKYEKLLEGPKNKKIRNYRLAGFFNGFSASGRSSYITACYLTGYFYTMQKLGIAWGQILGSTFLLFFAFMSIGA